MLSSFVARLQGALATQQAAWRSLRSKQVQALARFMRDSVVCSLEGGGYPAASRLDSVSRAASAYDLARGLDTFECLLPRDSGIGSQGSPGRRGLALTGSLRAVEKRSREGRGSREEPPLPPSHRGAMEVGKPPGGAASGRRRRRAGDLAAQGGHHSPPTGSRRRQAGVPLRGSRLLGAPGRGRIAAAIGSRVGRIASPTRLKGPRSRRPRKQLGFRGPLDVAVGTRRIEPG